MSITKISPSVVDFDSGITISTADNLDTLTLTSTDADASFGPHLRMYRNSSSPADDDLLGDIEFEGRNDNSQDVVYGRLFSKISDASDGTEDGIMRFDIMKAGSLSDVLTITPDELVINDGSYDYDFRVESNGNTSALFVDAGNDKVTTGVRFDFADLLIGTGAGKYIQVTGGSSNALAIGMDGGTAAPGTASTSVGFHHWNNSSWSNVMNVTRDGLAFGTDTATANSLDDYEEGTWTPGSLTGTIGTVTHAHYTKIGRLVHWTCIVEAFSDTSTNASITLTGLPFPVYRNQAAGSVFGIQTSETGAVVTYCNDNERVFFYTMSSGTWNTMGHNELSSGHAFYAQGTYHAE